MNEIFSGINSKFGIVAIFVIYTRAYSVAPYQTELASLQVCLVIAIKPQVTDKFCTVAILLF